MSELKQLTGIEIFQTGKWNGETYTQSDLQSMVDSFVPLKETLQPYVKLGHNEKQKLLAEDGLPAAGWIENIYMAGDKLLADIKDMPKTIYELIKNKAYKRISSEIYWNLKDSAGNTYKRALKAISLLGGDTPAVGSLANIEALYAKRYVNDLDGEVKTVEIEYFTKGDIMDLEKIKAEYEAKLAKQDTKIAEMTVAHKSELEAKDKAFSELETAKETVEGEKEALETKVNEGEEKAVESEVEKKVDELISKKKVLPANKQYAIDQLMKDVNVKVYSEKKEKMFDDNATIKFFESQADVVDTDSNTTDEQKKSEELKAEEVAKNVNKEEKYSDAKKVYIEGVDDNA